MPRVSLTAGFNITPRPRPALTVVPELPPKPPQRAPGEFKPQRDAKADALRHTITLTRRHARIAEWLHDDDTAHQIVIGEWRAHPDVALVLSGHERRDHKMLWGARKFLDGQQQLVAAAWKHLIDTLDWPSMPLYVQLMLERMYAYAREHGPNVPMSHDLLIDMIREAHGRKFSKNDISRGREWLVSHGILTATVGVSWRDPGPSRSTVYHLLATIGQPAEDILRSCELGHPATAERPSSHEGPAEAVKALAGLAPRLTDGERARMKVKMAELRAVKQRWDYEQACFAASQREEQARAA